MATALLRNRRARVGDYWAPGLETQSRGEWRRQTLDLLRAHLRHAYRGSPYYRASFDAAGLRPDHLLLPDVMAAVVMVLIVMVQLAQSGGDLLARHVDKRNLKS